MPTYKLVWKLKDNIPITGIPIDGLLASLLEILLKENLLIKLLINNS
jgi:hypothetical protein